MAMKDSGIVLTDELVRTSACLLEAEIGGLTFMGEQHRRQVEHGPRKGFTVPRSLHDSRYGKRLYVDCSWFEGPQHLYRYGLPTGANAIGDAYHIVKRAMQRSWGVRKLRYAKLAKPQQTPLMHHVRLIKSVMDLSWPKFGSAGARGLQPRGRLEAQRSTAKSLVTV